jgi:RNA polymerase sigma-70 factor (ECF subfamily)
LPATQTYTEQELVTLLAQQSREGFNYLYENYSAVLFGVIKRIIQDEDTARDVLQESFVKIWSHIGTYDPAKGRIYTWMINVTRNTAIDKLRSKGEVMKAKIHTGENVVDTMSVGRTEQSTDRIGLNNLVADLQPEYRAIVHMAYYSGYTMAEISKSLNIPLGTVKTRMRQAIKQLREKFSN